MWHFSLFCKFFGEEVETVFRESKSEPPKWFHFKVCQRKYFRNLLKLPWSQKRIFWEFENEFLNFFAHFSVNKLKMFLGKARQSMQNCVNPKSDIENVLENGLETTLWSKADVLLNLWKRKFSVFCTFLSQEVEIAYCESKAKRSKVFESKVGHGKHFRKWFRSNPVKPEYSEPLKRAFFRFLQIFEWRSWNHFQGKWGKTSETI